MKKRCVSLLLALVMAFSLTSGAAFAEEETDSTETTAVEETSEEETEEETTAVEEETEETTAETEETTAAEEEETTTAAAEEEETTAAEAEEETEEEAEEETTEGGAPDDSLIVSIQATSMPNFYGQKLGYVTITYADGTDLSGVSLDDYVIYDRGFNNPNFGEVELSDISVSGTVVTLTVDTGSDATESNSASSRSRETYGSLSTSSAWYIDTEGVIHYGSEASTDALGITFEPNTLGKGLQWRANLDLILCTNGKDITEGIASTDGAGTMLEDTVWEEMILGGGLDEVETLLVDIGSYAEDYTLLSDEGLVPVQIIYPDDYDPDGDETYTTIVYQCGGGVCYWEVTEEDGYTPANNLGCNVVYDEMMTKWHELMPDAIIISVNVHSSGTENSAYEITKVLDYGIENWNIDADSIVIVGNSQGTIIASDVIRQRPDLIDAYVECNGNFGAIVDADAVDGTIENSSLQNWTEEEVQAFIDNEISIWMFNGETDGSNPAAQQDVIEIVKDLYREAGKSEEWIDEHVRASGLQSWKFIEWGETDHSVTKVVASFYLENAYTDVWEDGGDLAVGSTYTFSGESDTYAYYEYTLDYEYTVYAESVSEWAKLVIADSKGETEESDSLTVDDIVSIQATTDGTIYGTGVVEVEIVYADDVDLTQYDLTADSYVLTDRGSLSPDYGEVPISDIEIDGQTVTLIIDDLTAATENNTLVYTGDDAEGSRERNVFGIYCTNAWYRDVNGVIYYGDGDEELGYEANTTGMGYQTRASLELKLRHADEDEDDALALADENGEYTDANKWLETIDLQFGEDGFQSFEELGIYIESTANNENITDGTDDEYVLGYAYIPEDYDPENGIIFVLQGQGISYWQLSDGTNNAGTSFYYDNSTSAWAEVTDAIVVNINDRSSAGPGEYWDYYDFVEDDVNVMKYFIETYGVTGNIVLQGNSRGTLAASIIIKALAGEGYNPHNQKASTYEDETYYLDKTVYDFEVDTFICNNGYFCYNYTEENYAAVAATGLRIWAFDGEQDVDNYDEIAAYTELVLDLYGEEWVEENVHLTGYSSEMFYYWGESDHSVTRLNGWYFYDSAYYGPDCYVDEETGELVYTTVLEDGDTYTLQSRGKASGVKDEYVYEVYDEIFTEWAFIQVEEEVDATEIVDIDTVESADIDYTASAQIPLEGWYEKTLDSGRTVKMYFSEYAACRAYFTIVAVPDGVEDVTAWAQEQGYVDLMEERGEVLVILEPADTEWGSLADELEYVTEAMTFVNSGKNADGITLFTNYSTFYLVGYGAGAASLEAWAAEYPIYVGSQAYIGGESAGEAYLDEVGAEIYDGTNTGGYDPGISDLDEFEAVLEAHGYEGEAITRSEVPVPTWFIGYDEDDYSISYWKSANDCLDTDEDGVFWQSLDSDAYATEYANSCTDENHGISQVKVSSDETVTAYDLADFLYTYSRYNIPFAYSNHLSLRQDYTSVRVAAQEAAQSAEYLTEDQQVMYDEEITSDAGDVYDSYYVLAREQEEVGEGIVESGIIAYSDDNGDGVLDAREYLMYIPDSAVGTDAPIVFQFPGNTQSVAVGFDSTQWWEVANDEGVIIVIVSEAYNDGVALTWKNADMAYYAIRDIIENDDSIQVDWTRCYGSGHSLGSKTVQDFVQEHPDFFAAVASTSFGSSDSEGTFEAVPTMLITGQSDLPFLMDNLWNSESLITWFEYLAEANNLKVSEATIDNADSVVDGEVRTWLYTWNNEQEIPMVVWGQTYVREHNCHPSEIPLMWDFLEHYSSVTEEDGTTTLYYSASAFEEDDLVEIITEDEVESVEATDLDTIEVLDYDYSEAAQLPLTGYFTKTVTDDNRTIKVYISEDASVRSYFTVVAVPDGVDTYEFLEENGYIELADEKGECLFILEPGEDGWGSAEEEAEYLEAAMVFLKNPYNDYSQNVFSTYGEFYLVGYGKGAAALELWAAQNPILVISQTYIDGESIGSDALQEVAEAIAYDGSSSNGDITDVLTETIETVGIDGEITAADVPVPTYLINYTGSEVYWQTANDCVTTGTEDGVYYQDIDSDAYATDYANGLLAEEGSEYGISQVEISTEDVDAAEIYAWLSVYTRYDTTFAYSNYLAYRLDYTDARVAAQQEAADGEAIETLSDGTEIWGVADTYIEGHGTVQVGVIAFSDNNDDGENDPREYLLYIPEGYEEDELPIVVVFPGNTQTDSIFMDSTLWWQVAEENGIVLAFVCETYNATPCSVSHADSDLFYDALMTILEEKIDGEYADLDFTRIYGTGQSAGSMASQGFAVTDPEMFAAVASTSAAPSIGDDASYESIPTLMLTGQMDVSDLASGFDSSGLQAWANYMLEVNGFSVTFSADTATSILSYDTRHQLVYSWDLEIDGETIPMVQWGQCLLRPHNCYPSDITILWDFLEHYSYVTNEDGTVTRYYSASAFEEDDLIEITLEEEDTVEVTDFDTIDSLDIDYSEAAQLPLTGYFTKTVTDDGRSVKVYISEDASIRSYFTVVAVPDGVDTYEFLEENGYIELADEKGEGLFILEPGEDGWGSAEEEAEYVAAAIAFLRSTSNDNGISVFSTYGEFYFVGYGKGAAALELWAAANPIYVISQTYIDGESVGSEALQAAAEAVVYDGSSSYGDISDELEDVIAEVGIDGILSADEVPIPTYLINYTGSEAYWQDANDCVTTGTEDGVYYQDINSDAYATEYANSLLAEDGAEYGISLVEISSESADAAEIYAWLSVFTRYDNVFAYSNYIAYRLDYTAAHVEAQQEAADGEVQAVLSDGTEVWGVGETYIEGHGTVQIGVIAFSDNDGDGENDPREYLLYIPEGYEEDELPVVVIYPGNTQTVTIFMDCSLWWQVAEENGFAIVFVGETYSAATAVTHVDNDLFYDALMTVLEETVDGVSAELDFTRIYGTGQSLGSMTTQGFAVTDPDMFAAVASTSGTPLTLDTDTAAYELIPTLLINGAMDILDLAEQFESTYMQAWGSYMLEADGFSVAFSADTASEILSYDSRHSAIYSWNVEIDGVSIPLVQYGETALRSHNFYPSDIAILWDFLEHYSMVTNEDGTVTRYYSASAFTEDDLIELTATSEDDNDGTEESTEASAESTTAAEDTTTAAEDTTTASAESTTAAEDTTTAAEDTTTASSETTTAASSTTTAASSSSSGTSTGDSSNTMLYVIAMLAVLGAACVCGGVAFKKRKEN